MEMGHSSFIYPWDFLNFSADDSRGGSLLIKGKSTGFLEAGGVWSLVPLGIFALWHSKPSIRYIGKGNLTSLVGVGFVVGDKVAVLSNASVVFCFFNCFRGGGASFTLRYGAMAVSFGAFFVDWLSCPLFPSPFSTLARSSLVPLGYSSR